MDARPDGTIGVVQNFGSDGSENETPERAVPVRGHQNEVRAFVRGLDDTTRRVSF